MLDFENKVIVVTGGGSDPDSELVGFGHQIAKDLYDHNAVVSILGRTPARLQDSARRITGKAEPGAKDHFSYHECDVTDERRVQEVFETIEKTHGRVYGLVNNAARNVRKPLAEIHTADIRRIIEVNLLGAMFCSKFALKQMLEEGVGSIVNISSIAAKGSPLADMPAYNASKRGLEGMSASISLDYGNRIRSNIIRPGYARTPLTDRFFEANPKTMQALINRQPFGGLVTPQDISDETLRFLDPLSTKNGWTSEISNGHGAIVE